MMAYQNTNTDLISKNEILIIGLGGAGTNIINSVSKYGLRGGETLAVSADTRALKVCKVKNKIQIGAIVRRGLACGGDPTLGLKAAQESENELRAQIKGKRIVFLCVGLGGGTGSGAAPLVTRIAREENAFVVVFATMPFSFEGARRREQAESALNELAAIASALVTFDNGRMAELVAPDQSIHDAFEASNQLISSSILSISRIALFPGIVHIGLDDLVSTLSAKRSRCLFGAGSAKGKTRVDRALKMALASPLIDKGKLLNTSEKVIVHICGGPTTTLQETERFMAGIVENLGVSAEIFFGVSIDESMGEEFTATIISSLPEEQILVPDKTDEESDSGYIALASQEDDEIEEPEQDAIEPFTGEGFTQSADEEAEVEVNIEPEPTEPVHTEPEPTETEPVKSETETEVLEEVKVVKKTGPVEDFVEVEPEEPVREEREEPALEASDEADDEVEIEEIKPVEAKAAEEENTPIRRRFAHLFAGKEGKTSDDSEEKKIETIEPEEELGIKPAEKNTDTESLFGGDAQADLFGEEKPKGRFEGESPNLEDGADLDIPTFLRSSD